MALLLARTLDILAGSGDFRQRYSSIVDPLAFFSGRTGTELTSDMIAGAMRGYYGRIGMMSAASLGDGAVVTEFVNYLEEQLPSEVASSRDRSFRLLGRQVDVGSALLDELHRSGGDALTIMAALGSERATTLRSNKYDAVRAFIGAHEGGQAAENWVQDLNHVVLYTLSPMVATTDVSGAYPHFMQTSAWRDRGLSTAVGAWVAFQHDVPTLEMRKAPNAETFGRRGASDLQTSGYVEPNPEAWERLASLARYLRSGLVDGSHGDLVSRGVENKLRDIEYVAAELMRIAAYELEEKDLSQAQMQLITSMNDRIAAYETFADKALQGEGTPVVAGVASGGMANGHPLALYVIVPRNDGGGGLMLTRGAIFSYYSTGATDAAFRQALATSGSKEQPDLKWMNSFVSSDRSFAQDASMFRAVTAALPASGKYEPTAAERKQEAANVQLDLESNVVSRSSGEMWYTVRAPRLDGSSVVVLVVNGAGQLVYRSYPARIEGGERYDMVPVGEMPSGQYFIRVIDFRNQTLASSRFVVVR
jgi:hypothetical protein